jgi:ribosomal protein S18 acetylase RimI-like enzyme
VIDAVRGLSGDQLAAIAALETRVVAADGGRLKLEWGTLRTRSGRDVEDLLWWSGDRLTGFAGLYAFGSGGIEIAGMVDPEFRRSGIATALLDTALAVCRERGHPRVLLVTPRAGRGEGGGRAFARQRGARLDHSEHALVLTGEPPSGAELPGVVLRAAEPRDRAAVQTVLAAAFGWTPSGPAREDTDGARTLVIEITGPSGGPTGSTSTIVGTVRVTRDGSSGGVYGFAVDPAWQGRGIGRDVLRRVCRSLRADGATRIGLEVEVGNDHALGLYTSVGFEPVTTEDYYEVRLD